MKIKCIRAGKTKGLTDNKIYDVVKENEIMFLILNDNGIFQQYKKIGLLLFRLNINSK